MPAAQLPQGFTLFETAIGVCALAWGGNGLIGARLPEGEAVHARARMARRFPEAVEQPPPPAIAAVKAEVVALMRGEQVAFQDAPLDLSACPPFNQAVYALTRAIPFGQTRTYGEIAEALDDKGAARAVGRALGENPIPIIVPCHRVLAAGGAAGGFSAPGGVVTKVRLLALERARTGAAPSLFDDVATVSLKPRTAR